jgi:hypothetical protein
MPTYIRVRVQPAVSGCRDDDRLAEVVDNSHALTQQVR